MSLRQSDRIRIAKLRGLAESLIAEADVGEPADQQPDLIRRMRDVLAQTTQTMIWLERVSPSEASDLWVALAPLDEVNRGESWRRRIHNALVGGGVETTEQLRRTAPADLLRFRNLGTAGIADLVRIGLVDESNDSER